MSASPIPVLFKVGNQIINALIGFSFRFQGFLAGKRYGQVKLRHVRLDFYFAVAIGGYRAPDLIVRRA